MRERQKDTSELGKFKDEIHSTLYKSKDIIELLLGDTSGLSAAEIRKEFKNHVKSHLFIDDTIQETETFIFYDVTLSKIRSNTKSCKVVMYLITHADLLDNYFKEGYYGNRIDILVEMVENALINDEEVSRNFGIGELSLDSVDIYNSKRFYGRIMIFDVPNFR